jgi:hypothetical protein
MAPSSSATLTTSGTFTDLSLYRIKVVCRDVKLSLVL